MMFTSSMYLLLFDRRRARLNLLSRRRVFMYVYSLKLRQRSAVGELQLPPIGMPLLCFSTKPAKATKVLCRTKEMAFLNRAWSKQVKPLRFLVEKQALNELAQMYLCLELKRRSHKPNKVFSTSSRSSVVYNVEKSYTCMDQTCKLLIFWRN